MLLLLASACWSAAPALSVASSLPSGSLDSASHGPWPKEASLLLWGGPLRVSGLVRSLSEPRCRVGKYVWSLERDVQMHRELDDGLNPT